MSGWMSDPWERPEDTPSRLPRVEDLPVAAEGFEREAVRQAFDAFYRHAAQLDATLRVLESVEAFGRQARDLRADIRALRIASWAPLPAPRPLPTPGYAPARALRGDGPVATALPRLMLEAAFIVLVAAGAAIAELPLALIVLLVVAAWAIVAVTEFVASSRRATLRPGLLPAPAGAESAAAPPPVPPVQPEPSQATMIDALPLPAAEAPAELEPEPQPAPSVAAESAPESEAPPKRRRRFWRRDADDEEEEVLAAPAEPRHVRVLGPREEPPARALDPWEEDADLPGSPAAAATGEAELVEPEAEAVRDAEPAPEPISPFEQRPGEDVEPTPVEPHGEPEVAQPAADIAAEPVAEPEPVPEPEEERARRWFRRRRAERPGGVADEPPLAESPPAADDVTAEPVAEVAAEAAVEVESGEHAEAESEPEEEHAAEPETPRRRFWQRNRRHEPEEPAGAAPALEADEPRHVRRVDVGAALDPQQVVVPWEAESPSPFAAEPKPAETWSGSPEHARPDRVDEPAAETPATAAESPPAGRDDDAEGDEPEPFRVAELDRRFSRSERLRRGRR